MGRFLTDQEKGATNCWPAQILRVRVSLGQPESSLSLNSATGLRTVHLVSVQILVWISMQTSQNLLLIAVQFTLHLKVKYQRTVTIYSQC